MALSARSHAVLDALPLEPCMRVLEIGALDGRHPAVGEQAIARFRTIAPGGRLLVDGGDPLREIPLR